MTVVTPKFGMGASVLRREDQAFIKGEGRYTDDINPAGLLHGYVLRSPVAKASFWRAYGIRHLEMPATPARIWTAMQEASPA